MTDQEIAIELDKMKKLLKEVENTPLTMTNTGELNHKALILRHTIKSASDELEQLQGLKV